MDRERTMGSSLARRILVSLGGLAFTALCGCVEVDLGHMPLLCHQGEPRCPRGYVCVVIAGGEEYCIKEGVQPPDAYVPPDGGSVERSADARGPDLRDGLDLGPRPDGPPDQKPLLPDGKLDVSPPVPDGISDQAAPISDGKPDQTPPVPDAAPDQSPPAPDGKPDQSPPVPDAAPDQNPPIPDAAADKMPVMPDAAPDQKGSYSYSWRTEKPCSNT